VWPTLRFLEFSPFAGLLYAIAFAYALYRFSKGRLLPIHILYFAIAVWAPLLILGYFVWYMPPRYAIGQLGYFVMCTFAGVEFLARDRGWLPDTSRLSWPKGLLLALLTLLIINPI